MFFFLLFVTWSFFWDDYDHVSGGRGGGGLLQKRYMQSKSSLQCRYICTTGKEETQNGTNDIFGYLGLVLDNKMGHILDSTYPLTDINLHTNLKVIRIKVVSYCENETCRGGVNSCR